MIKIGVVGALGKMGKEIVKAVLNAEDTELVMAVDIFEQGNDIGEIVIGKTVGVNIQSDIEEAIKTQKPDVVIDFTQPKTIYENICKYMNQKVKSVIGTTGLSDEQIKNIEKSIYLTIYLEPPRPNLSNFHRIAEN